MGDHSCAGAAEAHRMRWASAGVLAAVLLGAGFLALVDVARNSSPVWDETHLWGIGLHLVRTGRFDVPGSRLHPPLAYYLNSLGLLGADVPEDVFASGFTRIDLADGRPWRTFAGGSRVARPCTWTAASRCTGSPSST